jgi:hypothetical protein
MKIADLAKAGATQARNPHEISPFGPAARNEAKDLFGRSALAEEDDHVSGPDNADVAVEGIGGVEEGGFGARGDQGLGDLLGDEAALPDTGEEDGAPAMEAELGEGVHLGVVEVGEEEVEEFLLFAEEELELRGGEEIKRGRRRRRRSGDFELCRQSSHGCELAFCAVLSYS